MKKMLMPSARYGEALLNIGKKDEAIRMYKKSIELNPKNECGKKCWKSF